MSVCLEACSMFTLLLAMFGSDYSVNNIYLDSQRESHADSLCLQIDHSLFMSAIKV